MLWTQIVTDHGEMLYRAAYRILHDHGDAEDVVQDVMVEAYRRYLADGTKPASGLLRRMAMFRAIDRLRRRRRLEPIQESSLPDLAEIPDRAMRREEEAERLRHAIARLPSRQGECLLLRHVEGMTYQEIAESLGMSVSAVSTALHKARVKLRAAVNLGIRPEKR